MVPHSERAYLIRTHKSAWALETTFSDPQKLYAAVSDLTTETFTR